MKLSQAKMAAVAKTPSVLCCPVEMGEAHILAGAMLNYANYFDVSLDHILIALSQKSRPEPGLLFLVQQRVGTGAGHRHQKRSLAEL